MSDSSSSVKTSDSEDSNIEQVPRKFTTKEKIVLLSALINHRPVGVNRHFAMLCILDRLKQAGIECTNDDVWTFLRTLYNLEKIEEMEPPIPFIAKRIDFDTQVGKFLDSKGEEEETASQEEAKPSGTHTAEEGDEPSIPDDCPLSLLVNRAKRLH
ncbi:unnamed protein product [Soboliphyme baturini]|uniref:WIYLD domain-containing protein n=1 Tax=Soboliphyme baturini TaxID=241478 RepID=A0A183J0K2_9BILA|nr:unnamed protein product [Soboliphyme baturini]